MLGFAARFRWLRVRLEVQSQSESYRAWRIALRERTAERSRAPVPVGVAEDHAVKGVRELRLEPQLQLLADPGVLEKAEVLGQMIEAPDKVHCPGRAAKPQRAWVGECRPVEEAVGGRVEGSAMVDPDSISENVRSLLTIEEERLEVVGHHDVDRSACFDPESAG